MAAQDQSVPALLRNLVDEITRLIRQELRLAQAETSEKLTQLQTGALALIVGLLLGFCALLILLQAIVVALATAMPGWLASLIVGVVVAIVAFILVWQGQRNMNPANLVPERTLQSIRADKDAVIERAP